MILDVETGPTAMMTRTNARHDNSGPTQGTDREKAARGMTEEMTERKAGINPPRGVATAVEEDLTKREIR